MASMKACFTSSLLDTAVIEVRPREGDFVTVLITKPKQPQTFMYMEIGILEHIWKNIKTLSMLKPAHVEKNAMIRGFLVEELIKPVEKGMEHEYKTTVAIANILKKSRAPSIMYPSVAHEKKGINIAVKPLDFDNLFEITSCGIVHVQKKISDIHYRVLFLEAAQSIGSNGSIMWSNEVKEYFLNNHFLR